MLLSTNLWNCPSPRRGFTLEAQLIGADGHAWGVGADLCEGAADGDAYSAVSFVIFWSSSKSSSSSKDDVPFSPWKAAPTSSASSLTSTLLSTAFSVLCNNPLVFFLTLCTLLLSALAISCCRLAYSSDMSCRSSVSTADDAERNCFSTILKRFIATRASVFLHCAHKRAASDLSLSIVSLSVTTLFCSDICASCKRLLPVVDVLRDVPFTLGTFFDLEKIRHIPHF